MHANTKKHLSVCLYIYLRIGWTAVARRWVCFMAHHVITVGAQPVLSRGSAGAPSWEHTSAWVTSGRRDTGPGYTPGPATDWKPSDSLA